MSPLISRIAALSLAIGALAIFLIGIIVPLAARHRGLGEAIADARMQQARFEERVAEPRASGGLAVADAALFDGETEALVAAALQASLNRILRESGAEMRSMRTEPAIRDETLLKVPVTIDFDAGMLALQTALHRIEAGSPYLFIDDLSIRAGRRAAEEAGTVSVRLRVYGYSEAAP